MDPIRCCVERRAWPEAIAVDVHERITRSPDDARGAAETSLLWMPGQTIAVSFMREGATQAYLRAAEQIEERIQKIASEWTEQASLVLSFGEEASGIRIAFRDSGSWSVIGRQCLEVPSSEPTMNYGWLSAELDEVEFRRVVLHEFGHALGLVHEHQNPAGGIKWRRDAVIAFYKGAPNFWKPTEVEQNIFATYARDRTQYTARDDLSIMMYPIPKSQTEDGYSVGWNNELSATDKAFAAKLYPRRPV